jgi:hypothetical protein
MTPSRQRSSRPAWLWVYLQGRRRKRQQVSPPPAIPSAPYNLHGEDLGGGLAGVTWYLLVLDVVDGCSIEARHVENGAQFVEVGTTGPGVTSFQFDASGFSAWQFQVRAFNGSGYSDYSEPLEVDLA